jgi:signal peptidase I
VWRDEFVAWVKTLASAAVYATLIVTFGFQVARVEGQSMAPTLADQDRLIVNKLAYRLADPQRGDIVMLYYPLNPDKSFVKRVIAEENDTVRIVDGRVYVNDVPLPDDYVPPEYPQPRRLGPAGDSGGLLLRDGRPPEQQLRQPPLGLRAEEVHHRQGAAALVAGSRRVLALWTASAPPSRASSSASSSSTSRRGAKILLGVATGAVSGPHRRLPFTDRRRLECRRPRRRARRPPAARYEHPYGHRKFEAMASVGILVFLLLVVVQVLWAAVERLRAPVVPTIDASPLR